MPIGTGIVYNVGDLILSQVSSSGTAFLETKIAAATSSLIYFDSTARINSASLNSITVGTASYVSGSTSIITNLTASNISASGTSSFGYVGIGTTAPTDKLSVISGSTRIASTALAGALYFGNDTSNIYLQRDNSYDLSLVQNNDSNSALYLASAGNVYVNIDSNNNDTDKAFIVQNNALKAGTELFRVSETGNVGIGTTIPSEKLHVVGNGLITSGSAVDLRIDASSTGNASLTIDRQTTAAESKILLLDGNVSQWGIAAKSNSNNFVIRDTDSTERFTILKTNGNIGIGTINPVATLQVAGNVSGSSFTSSISNAVGFLGTSSWAINASTASYVSPSGNAFVQGGNSFGTTALLGTNDAQPLALETNGTTRLSINSNGNVAINTSTSGLIRLNISDTHRGSLGSSSLYIETIQNQNQGLATSANDSGITNVYFVNNFTSSAGIQNQAIFTQLYINGSGSFSGSYRASRNAINISNTASLDSNGNIINTYLTNQISPNIPTFSIPNWIAGTQTYVDLVTGNTTGSITNLYNHQIGSPFPSGGAGGITVTNSYGIYINKQKTTNIVTNGWGIYQADTGDLNIFAGKTRIGSTTVPVNALDVTGNISASVVTASLFFGTASFTTTAQTANALNTGNSYTISGLTNNSTLSQQGTLSMGSGYQILATTGTAPIPGISFVGDTNTGIYAPSADTIGFSISGSERVRIDSSGNVGIGTTSPTAKLEVNGSIHFIGNIRDFWANNIWNVAQFPTVSSTSPTYFMGFSADAANRIFYISNKNNDSSATDPNGSIIFRTGTTPSDRMLISYTGNVGIGTTVPTGSLHVNNSVANIPILNLGGGVADNNVSDLYVLNSYNTASGVGFAAKVIGVNISGSLTNGNIPVQRTVWGGVTSATAIALGTDGPREGTQDNAFQIWTTSQGVAGTSLTQKFSLSSTGDVGIGTTSPAYKLDVAGSVYGSNYFSVLTAATYGPSDNSAAMQLFGSTGSGGLTNTIKLLTGGSERVRIDSTGNVGIGTTSPAFTYGGGLEIERATTATLRLQYTSGFATEIFANSTGTNIYQLSAADMTFGTNNTERMRILSGGNVGIGTTSPGRTLEVSLSATGDAGGYLRLRNPNTTTNTETGIEFFNTTSTTNTDAGATIRAIRQSATNTSDLTISTTANSNLTEKLRITSGGNVGIGTPNPLGRLHITASATNGESLVYLSKGSGSITQHYITAVNQLGQLNYRVSSDINGHASQTLYYAGTPYVYHDTYWSSWINNNNYTQGGLGIGTNSQTHGYGLTIAKPATSGSLYVSGSSVFTGSVSINGLLNATASWANNVVSASFATIAQTANALNASNTYTIAGLTSAYVDVTGAGTIPTTGIYRPSTKTLGLSADSTLIFKISNASAPATSSIETGNFIVQSGNVGIGTANATDKLTVYGALASYKNGADTIQTQVYLANAGNTRAFNVQLNSGGTGLDLWSYNSSNAWLKHTTFNYDGNVGIGTAAPAAKLEITGSSNSALLNIKSPISGAILYVSGSGAVGIGTSNVGAFTLQVNGSFGATTKSFIIDHPTKAGKKLMYGSLESPYHGIRLTGRDTLKEGKCKVELPDYMYKLILHDSINIQLTGIKCNKTLYVDDINIPENYFTIAYDKAIFESYKDYDFFWDFTAIRADVPELTTEL